MISWQSKTLRGRRLFARQTVRDVPPHSLRTLRMHTSGKNHEFHDSTPRVSCRPVLVQWWPECDPAGGHLDHVHGLDTGHVLCSLLRQRWRLPSGFHCGIVRAPARVLAVMMSNLFFCGKRAMCERAFSLWSNITLDM